MKFQCKFSVGSAGLLIATLCGQPAWADEPQAGHFSPYASGVNEKRVLWGDTHLHTTLSLDARAYGVELDQADAYRFARGEEISSTHGLKVKLSRPLDFLVVSDHSDAMGAMSEIIAGNERFMGDKTLANWNKLLAKGSASDQLKARMEVMTALTDGSAPDILSDRRFFKEVWSDYTQLADTFNEKGRFTALIGYEWTSSKQGNNLHRNVLYRDDARVAVQRLPFTTAESPYPEDLWQWMADYEKTTGGRVLALAHNGNISNGLMFPEVNPRTGKPLTAEYAQARARWEPLYEVTQIKGDGETHPLLSRNDEFADYETWDVANFAGTRKTPDMFQYEYARSALRMGLQLQQSLGTNPYQFGMVGSTDSHTALSTAQENNFFGKMTYMEPAPDRWKSAVAKVGGVTTFGWQMVASGYAAVWAEENSREAIFDAMMRRETYATTGPRILVRFDARLAGQSVPMGGELAAGPDGSPVFTMTAQKDPIGANLDRIQIVKGWLDENGRTQEQVINVTWSDGRELGDDGGLSPVGNTVDVARASYDNSIGAPVLQAEWEDPDFDPKQSAFYYARVLEIPTPRWTAYEALRFGVQMSDEVPMITQERAYTSPIWVHPK
tara:strand:- start:56860 stop:58692 length:1833 start_codon:yes stop_codon:yes gene_type:complete